MSTPMQESRKNETVVGSHDLQTHQTDSSYLQLQHVDDLELDEFDNLPLPKDSGSADIWHWTKIAIWTTSALTILIIMGVWVFPLILDKVIIPLMEWETRTFKRPVLAVVLIASLSIFPVLLIPSGPSMWLAGMIFGYGFGFLIIMSGTLIGVSLPFMIARWLFHARIQQWVKQFPKRAALIRIADQGGWLQQYRVLLILRVSPIPYPLFNYVIATTNVKYGPYICSSATILIPESFITIYSGRLIKTLADIKQAKHHMTPLQITYNSLGFCLAVGVTIALTIYGKRALKELEIKDQTSMQEELNDFPANESGYKR